MFNEQNDLRPRHIKTKTRENNEKFISTAETKANGQTETFWKIRITGEKKKQEI